MRSSNSIKGFFVFFLALTLISACRWWQKAEPQTTSPTPFVAEELKNGIPFTTKEPENFQAEFVVSTGDKEDKTFVARVGDNRRNDYHFGQKNQVSVVQTADNKSFLIFNDKKVYAENSTNEAFEVAENPFDFLTTEWLNQKNDAKFESLSKEDGFQKYKVTFDENQNSESIIWVDENIGLLVKQEFYSINGEQRTLNFTFELKNFKLQPDVGLFVVPEDFRKISIEDFRKILQSED